MKIRPLGILALCISFSTLAWGDTLVLRNGTHLPGRVVSIQNGGIMFIAEGTRVRRFDVNNVARIEFNRDGDNTDRFNSDNYGDDQHVRYDGYGNRPGARQDQPRQTSIDGKYQEMSRAGVALGVAVGLEQASTDGEGRYRVYQNSTLYSHARTGTHEVHGSIREQYVRMGAENGRLGYPISDEMPAPDGTSRINTFEHGTITWNARTGARIEFSR